MYFYSKIFQALILVTLCVGPINSVTAVDDAPIPDNPSPEIWLRDYSSGSGYPSRYDYPIRSSYPGRYDYPSRPDYFSRSGYSIEPVDPAHNKNQNDTVFRLQNSFHHDFIIRNASSYIITKKYVSVTFICRATYPVVWSVPEKKQLNGVSYTNFRSHNTRSSEFSDNLLNNKLFDSYISIHIPRQLVSLTLTCSPAKSAKNVSIQTSSINLFNAASIYKIQNERETIQVYVPKLEQVTDSVDTTIITLPCRPSNPNTSVVLERQLESTGIVNADGNQAKQKIWKEVNISESEFTFDPMVGFMIRVNSLEERNGIVGLYRCTVKIPTKNHDAQIGSTEQTTLNKASNTEHIHEPPFLFESLPEQKRKVSYQPVVYFNVSVSKHTDLKENSKFERKMELRGNASVSLKQAHFIESASYPPASEVVCCSGLANHPPQIRFQSCKDHIQCQIANLMMDQNTGQNNRRTFRDFPESLRYSREESIRYSRGASDCTRVAISFNAIVTCKAETMNVSEIYTNVFQNNITPTGNRTNELESQITNSTNAMRLQQYEPAAIAQESHKAILTLGYPTTRENFLKNKQHKYLAFINAPNDRIFYNSKHKPIIKSNSSIVGEYSRDFYYEGEPMVAVCLGWKYFHADGARITVLWKNGTRTVVDEQNDGKHKENFMYFSKGVTTRCVDERELVHVFSKKFTALKDMVSVECWLPQWNTDKWDKITRNVSIVDAIAPEFAEGEKEQVVTLKLGEESGKQIECQVVKGAPEPKITVTKTGKWVIGRYNDNGEDRINKVNVTIGMNETKVGAEGGVITAKIQFGKVTQDMEGVYQCVAENFGGKDIRTFKVVVQ